ncbi:DUF3592 domain-containing protein [Stigmatella aurantiaca]|uniref:Conserved uncharacterized protein n=1 Tax=Stigmatella aurantiaca (strain DW4/3-1) TaxID=378806 RepID=Q08Y67_STIAD|nr:DUF3592 domain-containing protein [Stigmatella aurantiaca]ADO67941.1 conserved uncharacterized protein [Stigmatella aurantiaca DW4/3-1]EAU65439.1 hypothetical protein STIAU_2873 [Stigmatella aurantiaca DW4/3-1]
MGFIFLAAGIAMGVICLVTLARTRRFLSQAHETQAEVVGNHSRRHNRKNTYYPVLRYLTQEGAQHEVVSPVGSNPPRYREGDRVPLLYNPANPQDVRIHNFLNLWLLPLLFGFMGAAFLLVGVLALSAGALRR